MKVRCLGDAKTAATASDDVSTQKQLGLATCNISNPIPIIIYELGWDEVGSQERCETFKKGVS